MGLTCVYDLVGRSEIRAVIDLKNAGELPLRIRMDVNINLLEELNKLGIYTIKDLLFYFPSRHLDRTTVLTAAKAYGYVKNGYDGEVTIIAKVIALKSEDL